MKQLVASLLIAFVAPVGAEIMSVNVSSTAIINPFEGYKMTYTDKDRNSCTFRYKPSDDGYQYLTADKECPSFVTERKVFLDAQEALKEMNIISYAATFAELYGDDGYGNKVERAELAYRCAPTSAAVVSNPIEWAGINRSHMTGFVFMPIRDHNIDGWYQLDLAGYNTYENQVGAWTLSGLTITGSFMGRIFTIPIEKISPCKYRRMH